MVYMVKDTTIKAPRELVNKLKKMRLGNESLAKVIERETNLETKTLSKEEVRKMIREESVRR